MTTTIRSELKTLEQAIRHNWEIPEQTMQYVPRRMLEIMAKSKNERNAIAAARVLAVLVKQSQPDEPTLHLHSHQGPKKDLTIDQQRADNTRRIDRLKRLGRMSG